MSDQEKTIIRVDDISQNSDIAKINRMAEFVRSNVPNSVVLYAISPLCHELSDKEAKGRVFPAIFSAMSDPRIFYTTNKLGIPKDIPEWVIKATHGLIHVDHRLLSFECQEMSILTSAYLVGSNIFVPPFNKWNQATEEICCEAKIALVKFEDNWLHMSHNKFDPNHKKYYCHEFDFADENKFYEWFK